MGKFSSPLGLIILCAIVSLLISEHRVSGQCCRSSIRFQLRGTGVQVGKGLCGDNTSPTPCCGYRPCNIFCCNCSDGGCRRSGRRRGRDVNAVQQGEHEHDKNKDGFYEKHEVHNLLLSGSCGNYSEKVGKWETEFQRMDKDKDGKLSYEEINENVVPVNTGASAGFLLDLVRTGRMEHLAVELGHATYFVAIAATVVAEEGGGPVI
ncbi:unnamed protein product [Orchesella dallaii]|uniref:EF-hand domain-containing protein n=1 Tax=Orchesella dallaii TaxID=48710 RepID=A0ABP1RPU2_9HEXA